MSRVRNMMGPIASFKLAGAVTALPKTRSGKIIRKSIATLARSKPVKVQTSRINISFTALNLTIFMIFFSYRFKWFYLNIKIRFSYFSCIYVNINTNCFMVAVSYVLDMLYYTKLKTVYRLCYYFNEYFIIKLLSSY